jgi:predicted Zn-dependent protease
MKSQDRPKDAHRPLIGSGSKLGLVGGAALALAFLLPLAIDRQEQARRGPPDFLSLVYLRLGLAQRPQDVELRFSLAQRSLQAGLFDEARQLLRPLAEVTPDMPPSPSALRARDVLVDIEFLAWIATPVQALGARSAALARFHGSLDAIDLNGVSAPRLQELGERCAQTGDAVWRAEILGKLASREPLDEAHVALADAAYLGAGEPLEAAELHAQLAERLPLAEASPHALLALERARSAQRPRAALALFHRLRPRFPEDTRLLELGLSLSAGIDDATTLELAEQLLMRRPSDAALRRQIAQLSDYTGQSLRAMEQYLWLGKHGGGSRDMNRALDRARAKSDLQVTLSLTPGTPAEKPALIERIALYEALGQVGPAISTLDAALASHFSDDLSLWQLKLQLHLRAGKSDDALRTLQAIEARFPPQRELVDMRVNLLLSLGRLPEALDTLARASDPADEAQLRKISLLAWELGDAERARKAYAALVATPDASEWDYQRLWLLAQEAKDYRAGVETAFSAWQRFRTPGLLGMAIYSAMAWDKPVLLEQLLASAEAAGPHFSANPAYWQMRIHLQQQQADRALAESRHTAAKAALAISSDWLARAEVLAPDPSGDTYQPLQLAQQSQVLALALASDDRATLARIYPSQAPHLAARQQVNILYRLGRTEQAAQLALDSSERSDLPSEDRSALADDARTLTQGMPRQLSVAGGVNQLEGLRTLSATASAQYSWTGRALAAAFEFDQFLPTSDAPFELGDPRELSLELSGHLERDSLTLGAVTRDARPRPFARFEHAFFEPGTSQLSLKARLNDRSNDTAALRILGVEDELALVAYVALPAGFYMNGKAAGKTYSSRDREYLGAGVSLDAGVGRNLPLPQQLGQAAVGLATYVAPRFRQADALGIVPDGTTWLGATASLRRGDIGLSSVTGGSWSFLLDVASGWLWPQDALGWWGSAGVGIPLVGGDLLSLSARAGNVLSAAPGSSSFGLNASYAVSQW